MTSMTKIYPSMLLALMIQIANKFKPTLLIRKTGVMEIDCRMFVCIMNRLGVLLIGDVESTAIRGLDACHALPHDHCANFSSEKVPGRNRRRKALIVGGIGD